MNQVIEVVKERTALRDLFARFVDLDVLNVNAGSDSRRLIKEVLSFVVFILNEQVENLTMLCFTFKTLLSGPARQGLDQWDT